MARVTELWTGHIEGTFPKNGKMVRRDAVWGGAVVETDPTAPAGMRWRYVAFFCARGQTPRVQTKPTSSEREATTLWRSTRDAKMTDGYKEINWKESGYGLEMTVRELGQLPDSDELDTRVHDFTYGTSNADGVRFCRICGKIRAAAVHGFDAATAINQIDPPARQEITFRPERRPAAPKPKPVPPEPAPAPVVELPDLAIRRGRRKSEF